MITRKIFLWILVLLFTFFAFNRFGEYRQNHQYYIDMLKDNTNVTLTIFALVCAWLPTYFLLAYSKFTFKQLAITVLIWLLIFGVWFIGIKETFIGNGILMLIVNMLIIVSLSVYFVWWLLSLGLWVSRQTIKLPLQSMFDIICFFGLGLATYMLINFVLIMLGIYYGVVVWIFAIVLWYLIYLEKAKLQQMRHIVELVLRNFQKSVRENPILMISAVVLCLISIAYYFHGFMLAYIPYPTAWDANHAYMYIPKVFTLSHGYMRSNLFDGWFPTLWYSYIAFWFALFTPLSRFRISPDTIAVQMNFISGVYVLVAMLVLISELINLIKVYKTHSQTSISAQIIHEELFHVWWMYILLRLTSGMGAFLIFVDNKTDLWIMTLILLWLIPGIRLITNLIHTVDVNQESSVVSNKILSILSGGFFAIAVLSKPTALFDVMNYALLYWWLLVWLIMMFGIMLIVPSVLSIFKANNVDQYIPTRLAKIFWIWGLLLGAGDTIRHVMTQQMRYLRYLMMRGLSFICVLCIVKWPVIVATSLKRWWDLSPSTIVKRILLGLDTKKIESNVYSTSITQSQILFANNNLAELVQKNALDSWSQPQSTIISSNPIDQNLSSSSTLASCRPGKYSSWELNQNLKEVIGSAYQEDVGRYVWYGQKEFKNPRWKFVLPSDTCLSLHKDAKIMCQQYDIINRYDVAKYQNLLESLPVGSAGYILLQTILASWSSISPDEMEVYKTDSIKKLNTYRSERVIKTTNDTILIPYVYILPFNISFNRSLQNLSSYYTDIGIVWLPLFIIVILSVLYAIFTRDRLLGTIATVTLFARWMWMMIGWGILRYGIGLIIWTIATTIVLLDRLADHRQDMRWFGLYHTIVWLMIIWAIIQFVLNFVRISSQGGGWPFVHYKFSNGIVQEFDESLAGKTVNKFPYVAHDILNIQFPHYNKVISISDQRKDKEVIMIAGTYLQYFLNNQYNIFGDGFLTEFWKLTSDGDLCKTYLRLKDRNRRYMAIDPNIGTVVMGGGNSTLFDRFFAKLDPAKGTIIQDGTMTMLSKLVSQWYIKMRYSNNLWAKYAYTLSDWILSSKIGSTDPDMLALARARIATARFWQNWQQLIGLVQAIFTERMANGDALEDIADILGKDVDTTKLKTIASTLVSAGQLDALSIAQYTKNLNQDERFILLQYINLFQLLKSNKTQFDQSVMNLIAQSVGGSSQLIFFEIL